MNIPDHYNGAAKTPGAHLDNVLFQAANVSGWIGAGDKSLALIKAECLLDSAQALVDALKRAHFCKTLDDCKVSFAGQTMKSATVTVIDSKPGVGIADFKSLISESENSTKEVA